MSDLQNSSDENLVKGFQMKLYRATIFATPIIFGAMLIVLLCLLHIKRRRGMSDRTHRQGLMQLQVFTGTQLNHEEGLSKSFREKLPVVLYDNKTSSSFQVSQCAVCLSDYQVDEKIKQLPACNHSFHVHCIDEWLAKNVTCPICRTALTKEEVYNAMELWSTRDGECILWEERVINGAPNQGSLTSVDLSNNSSTRGTPSNEVTVDMDRI